MCATPRGHGGAEQIESGLDLFSRERPGFADSPVEGESFEPSVPVAKELVCVAEFELRGIEKGGNPRWDETVLPAGVLRFEKGESYSRWPQPARAPA